MGYRKAAKLRRCQYVSGHYRTSKNGTTYWVDGHIRNEIGPLIPITKQRSDSENLRDAKKTLLFLAGPATLGVTWVILLILNITEAK